MCSNVCTQPHLPSLCYAGKFHARAKETSPSENSPPRERIEYVFKRREEKGIQAMPYLSPLTPTPILKSLPRLTRQVTHSIPMGKNKECGKRPSENSSSYKPEDGVRSNMPLTSQYVLEYKAELMSE